MATKDYDLATKILGLVANCLVIRKKKLISSPSNFPCTNKNIDERVDHCILAK